MLIVMKSGASDEEVQSVIEKIEVSGRKVIAGFRLPAAVDAIKCHGADGASCAVFKNKDRLMVGCFQ